MCRTWTVQFAECGHVFSTKKWAFPCDNPDGHEETHHVVYRQQHCFRCLEQERMPEKRSGKYPQTNFCRLRANRRIDRMVSHVRTNPHGDQRFIDTTSFESLSLIQEQLSEDDIVFLEMVEEQSDEVLWNTKDWIQDMPKQQAYFVAHRIVVLQLRYAILNARVLLFELDAVAQDKLAKAKADWQVRCANRRLAFMERVRRHEVVAEEELECPICYRDLQGWWLPGFPTDHYPVSLPCGHIFSLKCIANWICMESEGGGDFRDTCPICREDLDLKWIDKLDWAEYCKELASWKMNQVSVLTPWWITMLRGVPNTRPA